MLDAKIGIRQFIITLSSSQRTHTHQPLTPTRAFTSRLRSDFPPPPRLRGNSSSLPDPIRVPQTRSPRYKRNLATPNTQPKTQSLEPEVQGRPTKNPVSTPHLQTLSGLPGRRRGSLTRHKLRTVYPQHKSAGQRLFCAVRSGRTVAVLPHVRLCGRRSVPGSRRRRHPLPNAGRTPPWGRTSWPALPG